MYLFIQLLLPESTVESPNMKKALVVVVVVLVLVSFMRLWDLLKLIEAMNWIKVMQTKEQSIGKFCFAIL